MGNRRMVTEDETLIFRSYPYPSYFVHSPSTASHANSINHYHIEPLPPFHSPLRLPHSSSLGSNGSYSLHEKKISYDLDHQCHEINDPDNDENSLIHDCDDDYVEDEENGWVRYLSFSTYPSSPLWICLQIMWRFLVSFGVALLVFYFATRPPPPHVSVEITKIRDFGLGEGADATGVTTKILSLNCSINLLIKNKSQLFGLHVQSPIITMSFGHLPLAISHGPNFYARSDGSTLFRLFVSTRNKPMYGAGKSMEDMLENEKGLALVVHLSMRSKFRVIWGLINPKFNHKAECLLLLRKAYDKKHHTQTYNSRCITM